MSKVKTWIITVGGGYGSFEFVGTEEEAEEMRRHKAEWEGAVARKRLKSEIIPDESTAYGDDCINGRCEG